MEMGLHQMTSVLTSNINTVNNLYLDSLSIYNLIEFKILFLRIMSVNPIDSVDLSNNDSLTHVNFRYCVVLLIFLIMYILKS